MFYGCKNNGTMWAALAEGRRPVGRESGGRTRDRTGDRPWVVKLPVFECQEDAHCSGADTWAIVGGVCFEIREILEPSGDYDDSSKLIKGRFLCPNSADANERALFDQYCRDSEPRTGRLQRGMRADRSSSSNSPLRKRPSSRPQCASDRSSRSRRGVCVTLSMR